MIKRENLKRDAFVIGKTDKYLNNRLIGVPQAYHKDKKKQCNISLDTILRIGQWKICL